MQTRKRPYVGLNTETGTRDVFMSEVTPTEVTHPAYKAVIGPFKTKRGANYMAKYGGYHSPHLVTVADAERGAREELIGGTMQAMRGQGVVLQENTMAW